MFNRLDGTPVSLLPEKLFLSSSKSLNLKWFKEYVMYWFSDIF
ncbi:hypothetical protein JCM19274_2527 [Algibacter lectus]|uniref:Uncharacterized protein n=1 Tax=Algibacter lectus TaxID=221126 RepID=A0A090WRW1_9FLAO|nr:hypothetical protein JCM19274_2527 [Algibacter lectus]